MIEPIHTELFNCYEGSPELQRVWWTDRGRTLGGIDYGGDGEMHVDFTGVQVVMITPDEVVGENQFADVEGRFPGAAMFNCGRSDWLQSFDGSHLARCSHFRLVFEDEVVDVICESVECGHGSPPG